MVDLKAEWQEAMARKRTMSFAERKRMGAKGELVQAKALPRMLMFQHSTVTSPRKCAGCIFKCAVPNGSHP